MHEIIIKSKFVFLNSHKEGVPRIIIESFSKGVPCIVSKKLNSGINYLLNDKNTLYIDDEISLASKQIYNGFIYYERFNIDSFAIQKEFCDIYNKDKLKDFLIKFIGSESHKEIDLWHLDDLIFRLACHGRKNNMQFLNNENIFFDWFSNINITNSQLNEDLFFRNIKNVDKAFFSIFDLKEFLKSKLLFPLLSIIKSRLIIILNYLNLI